MILPADVADDDGIGPPVEVRGLEALEASDVLLLQLRRHRRVDVLVRATHVMPCGLQQPRERAHAGAADADEVNLHFGTHSLAWGRCCVGKRFTSSVNFRVRSRKIPSSRLPMPPEVSQTMR